MKSYIAYIKQNLRLTFRDKTVLFFNYLFPLIFFFIFGQLNHAERGGAAAEVVTMVLTIGILGGGFFGAGMRAVMDREANILRRFKVAPITPGPIIASSLVAGFVHYVPKQDVIYLDWPIEEGLRVVVSGGVVQPAEANGVGAQNV